MTTTCAVAARRADKPHSVLPHRSTKFVLAAFVAVGVAGCSGGSLLGNSNEPAQTIATAAQAPTKVQPVSQSKVALAPIVGAPDAINKQMAAQLQSALEKQRVAVATGGDKADYTLRGYVVAAKDKAGVKVSYIWDITDLAGKRVNRIQGEEFASGGDGRDPWSAVSEQLTQTISDKTAASLATSLSSLPALASTANAPVGVGAAGAQSQPMQTASLPNPAAANAARSSSGTQVLTVTGAPGDGNTSLMAAMRDELVSSGISAAQQGQPSYTVAGKVTIGAVKEGKQAIRIDWKVTDPGGAVLATVSQNNEIATGALDGAWGAIANDAAQGAAVKIKTLIEESQTGNSSARGPVRREVRSKT